MQETIINSERSESWILRQDEADPAPSLRASFLWLNPQMDSSLAGCLFPDLFPDLFPTGVVLVVSAGAGARIKGDNATNGPQMPCYSI